MLTQTTNIERRALTDPEVATELGKLAGWVIEGEKLTKRFSFKSYKDGLVFALAVGHVADHLNHHPDLAVGYAKVKVAVSTHSVGGLSLFDFELARRVDALLQ